MADKIPFDEDAMTLIMGLGGPSEPGQHGRTEVPMPEQDAIGLVTQIKDLCEEFLLQVDKASEKQESEKQEAPESEDKTKEEEE